MKSKSGNGLFVGLLFCTVVVPILAVVSIIYMGGKEALEFLSNRITLISVIILLSIVSFVQLVAACVYVTRSKGTKAGNDLRVAYPMYVTTIISILIVTLYLAFRALVAEGVF